MIPVPLPTFGETELTPPDHALVDVVARGVVTALGGSDALSPLQAALVKALFQSMTGFDVTTEGPAVGPQQLADALVRRNEEFRVRVLQLMILCALAVRPLPSDTVTRLDDAATALSVGDGMLTVARDFAAGSLALAAVDFERNGYASGWTPDQRNELPDSSESGNAWAFADNDPELAARWVALESLPPDTLGRLITDFYRARGFEYPGRPGSAPPLLAQHDWVHVLADFGTKVESELEVFAFIARANDDPRAFSLLAMVVSLFETGYLATGAGLFEAFPGQLSHDGVAIRVADAMRRGALAHGSIDFMNIDWFALADRTIEDVRQEFGIVPKSPAAIAAGSVGPWEPGGISEYQIEAGRRHAAALDLAYDPYGASVE
jgi:hypothetical protein